MYFLEKCEKLFFTKTVLCMIIHHSNSLEIGINNSRPDETHASFFEIFWESIWKFWACLYFFETFWIIFHDFSSDKVPKIFTKTSKFLLDLQKDKCIFANRKYFESVSNNSFIFENNFKFFITEFWTFFDIKITKNFLVACATFQNCFPGKSCLGSF